MRGWRQMATTRDGTTLMLQLRMPHCVVVILLSRDSMSVGIALLSLHSPIYERPNLRTAAQRHPVVLYNNDAFRQGHVPDVPDAASPSRLVLKLSYPPPQIQQHLQG